MNTTTTTITTKIYRVDHEFMDDFKAVLIKDQTC